MTKKSEFGFMKYLLAFLMGICALQINAQTTRDKADILELLENQRQGWNKGDMDSYMQGYWKSDSLLFVGKNGPTYGWQKNLG